MYGEIHPSNVSTYIVVTKCSIGKSFFAVYLLLKFFRTISTNADIGNLMSHHTLFDSDHILEKIVWSKNMQNLNANLFNEDYHLSVF